MSRLSKVLIVYASRPPISEYLARAFERLGVQTEAVFSDENTLFDKWVIHTVNKQAHNLRILPKHKAFFENHPLAYKNFFSGRLKSKIETFQPDLVFFIRGTAFDHSVFDAPTRFFAWWVEAEGRIDRVMREIDKVSWYFFMNQSYVDEMHQRGYENTSFLPHCVDPTSFYKIPDIQKKYDLCFVGGWSKKRQEYIEAALEVTNNIAVYGGGWRKKNLRNVRLWKCLKGKYIGGEPLNRLYNSSRIVLNVTNWGAQGGNARSGMTMRVLEVPATGAFLLTDTSREMADFFSETEHMGVYEGLHDFVQKLRYWLSHTEEREKVAAEGEAHVRSDFSYDMIAKRILEKYEMLFPN